VFDWDPAPLTPRKKGHSPNQFLAHVYCGQTAGCVKMSLGTDVSLGPGDVVLEGVAVAPPAPSKRGTAPSFRFMSGLMKTPVGTTVDLGPGHIVLDGDRDPHEKGTAAPVFRPCVLWPRSPISATAELIVICKMFNVRHFCLIVLNYNIY